LDRNHLESPLYLKTLLEEISYQEVVALSHGDHSSYSSSMSRAKEQTDQKEMKYMIHTPQPALQVSKNGQNFTT